MVATGVPGSCILTPLEPCVGINYGRYFSKEEQTLQSQRCLHWLGLLKRCPSILSFSCWVKNREPLRWQWMVGLVVNPPGGSRVRKVLRSPFLPVSPDRGCRLQRGMLGCVVQTLRRPVTRAGCRIQLGFPRDANAVVCWHMF